MSEVKNSISRHKTVSTRVQTGDTSRAFDIIPPGKVKPSASSRPVILPAGPAVQDTTLTTSTGAPELAIGNRQPDIGAPDPVRAKAADTGGQGVLLTDLVAKRQKAAVEPTQDELDEQMLSEDIHPASDDTAVPADIPQDVVASVPKQSEPEEENSEASEDAGKAEGEAAGGTDHKLSHVLRSDDRVHEPHDQAEKPTAEHSDSLKQAMGELEDHEGKPHYELYGGKPVIVVHKHHRMSALVWMGWFLFSVTVSLLIVNFLLDAGIIVTDYIVPHTNFF